jgi:hypothetical protein
MTTNQMTIQSIKKELLVEASQETCFKVFTGKMDLWWPRTHHVGACPMVESVLEPGVNGRWYSRHEDGSEVNVGYVLEWDPYAQVVLAWQIDGNFKCDPTLLTEVEVKFIPEGAKQTRIKFEHKNIERLGSGKHVDSMNEGWGYILNLYKQVTENE